MLFNSIDFALFLPIVFCLYWFCTFNNVTVRNILLSISSIVFYGWWDWRFLILILISAVSDYFLGLQMYRDNGKSNKTYLFLSLFINLGLLGFFKYFNFFIESFINAFSFLGIPFSQNLTLNIILPVGISFYTFQTLSYTIDIYKGKIKPVTNFIQFFTFVSFFPQLVAGPIERAKDLLPQFERFQPFALNDAIWGLKLILWGMFKKVVIADNFAIVSNNAFDLSQNFLGFNLIIGAFSFAVQIYCDFSGYSDIAIGLASLFSIKLSRNFAYPYFSRSIAEFWRRWHISLTTWFRDYVYIPLGGSRVSKNVIIRNTFIVFMVSGLWHGANWTFIFWGLINAIFFIPLVLNNANRKYLDDISTDKFIPDLKTLCNIFITFLITSFAWIFFRSESIYDSFVYIFRIFDFSQSPLFNELGLNVYLILLLLIVILIEWNSRSNMNALDGINIKSKKARLLLYYALVVCIIYFHFNGLSGQEFIYFQF